MSEYHVCGVMLMARPEQAVSVAAAIRALPGAELHAIDRGRMVVTIEGTGYDACAQTLDQLAVMSGVASASLVYHEIEKDPQSEEAQP